MNRIFRSEDTEKAMGFASAVQTGQFLWVSGVVSWDATMSPIHVGDTRAQLGEVYSQLAELLAANGSNMAHIVKETIYTTDVDGVTAALEERRRFFGEGAVPASTLIGVSRLIHPDLRIEVEVVAMIADGAQ
ncbi:RidA family protein [Altererythrobacter arenosus]|uniref:RidA family protein n=1 Tax=Altererythrobacter arenosus TaxID=3032592 RepID=A0ABY8FRU5_9SPHN|nr:RidA family protein [Altererythrobacter sp. CAU 1644]WFL77738.1 RidA family protein [Altererythrobacter sp. CAU 1644]